MEHLWQCAQSEQVACFCRPLMLEGLAFHRPWPGYVFWDKGEQGPQVAPIDWPPQ